MAKLQSDIQKVESEWIENKNQISDLKNNINNINNIIRYLKSENDTNKDDIAKLQMNNTEN
jgi:peptidoglycan hydrolase CwlO-like protein